MASLLFIKYLFIVCGNTCHSVYWFSSYHVGHTQAVRLSDKSLHHLSHFTGPHLVFLLNLFCVDTQILFIL